MVRQYAVVRSPADNRAVWCVRRPKDMWGMLWMRKASRLKQKQKPHGDGGYTIDCPRSVPHLAGEPPANVSTDARRPPSSARAEPGADLDRVRRAIPHAPGGRSGMTVACAPDAVGVPERPTRKVALVSHLPPSPRRA